jgi:hypothetical protein
MKKLMNSSFIIYAQLMFKYNTKSDIKEILFIIIYYKAIFFIYLLKFIEIRVKYIFQLLKKKFSKLEVKLRSVEK